MYKEKMINDCSMTIAGLDPSGGAGIIADCKTFHAHAVYATCVTTAITAQNPYNVSQIEALTPSIISEEIDLIMDVYPIEYIKTGMLYSSDIIQVVSKKIKEYDLKAVVDPVMISESGKSLLNNDYVESFKKNLLEKAYIITPNIHEAEILSDKTIEDEEDMIEVAESLSKYTNIVITGGHMQGNDILSFDDKIHKINGKLIDTDNTHGTGCTYSSAITSIIDSCKNSNEFIQKCIKNGFNKTPYQFWDKIKM